MSTEPPTRRRIWVEIDWDAPGPAVALVGEFVRAARPSDGVELGLATGTSVRGRRCRTARCRTQ